MKSLLYKQVAEKAIGLTAKHKCVVPSGCLQAVGAWVQSACCCSFGMAVFMWERPKGISLLCRSALRRSEAAAPWCSSLLRGRMMALGTALSACSALCWLGTGRCFLVKSEVVIGLDRLFWKDLFPLSRAVWLPMFLVPPAEGWSCSVRSTKLLSKDFCLRRRNEGKLDRTSQKYRLKCCFPKIHLVSWLV